MTWKPLFAALVVAAYALPTHTTAQTAPVQKVSVVTVTGCLTQGPANTWLLTNATDPVPVSGAAKPTSSATIPPLANSPRSSTAAVSGKNRFKLIGILELNVPAHKGHTVMVRGLLIPAQPERRINLTNVQMVADSCSPAGDSTSSKPPKTS